jgi:hypothetical protein
MLFKIFIKIPDKYTVSQILDLPNLEEAMKEAEALAIKYHGSVQMIDNCHTGILSSSKDSKTKPRTELHWKTLT